MYTSRQAQAHFEGLIDEVLAGKEVVLARGKKPIAKLVPVNPKELPPPKPKAKRRGHGSWKGKIWAAPDAFDPLTDEELKDWGIE